MRTKNITDGHTENKQRLIDYFLDIVKVHKFPIATEIEAIHKTAIAGKNFDLVSIAMSILSIVNQKNENTSYYKTLLVLSDAKILAQSSNSGLAKIINLFAQAYIEYYEKNYESALLSLKSAQSLKCGCSNELNIEIQGLAHKIQRTLEQEQINQSAPSFSPKLDSDDPLLALLKVGRTIAVETNIDVLLKIVAQEIKLALNADRCTVFLHDKEKGELWSKVATGMGSEEIRFASNFGIAGYVVTTGDTINIDDAYKDERFNKEIDMQTGYKTRNILCMPIMNMTHEIVGVFQVLNKIDGSFTQKDEDILLAIGSTAGIALDNASLFEKQQKLIEEQKELLSSFIDTLSASIDARDKITSGHSKRVTMYAGLICEKLGFSQQQKEVIRQASLLHDIGKIGIKDSVLQKEGKLSDDEYGHIKEHAHLTHDILSKIYLSKDFQEVTEIASSHHERYDGRGYYQGRSGNDIPLGGRMLAVCDVFDAITSKRHYRSRMNIEKAIEILIQDSDKHFDKKIVDIFLSLSTNRIMEVFLADVDIKLSEDETSVLSKFSLFDIHKLLTTEAEHSQVEHKFIDVFLKYYEERA